MKWLLVSLVVWTAVGAAHAQVAPVSKDECAAWLDHLIPLPHESVGDAPGVTARRHRANLMS